MIGAYEAKDGSRDGGEARVYVQTALVLSSGAAYVAGDYSQWAEGSAAGLVRDVSDPSGTGALVDGVPTGAPPGCSAGSYSGYPVRALSSGESETVSKPLDSNLGTVSATAICWL